VKSGKNQTGKGDASGRGQGKRIVVEEKAGFFWGEKYA